MNWRFSLAAALAGWTVLCAHEPITTQLTWSQEISRIVYRRCAGCHREGGPAPMALLSYSQVRPWAKAVKDEVLERRMPPWGAVKGFGDFQNDAGLSQDEILRVAAWVEGGAPEGDPAYLPVLPAGGGEPKLMRLRRGLTLRGNATLQAPLRLRGLHPLADAASVQVTAVRPDGSVEPLIWLRNYQARWNRTFVPRAPVDLPKGTRILIDPPLPIRLQP